MLIVLTRHTNNIIIDEEINKKSNVRKTHFGNSDRPVSLHIKTSLTKGN